MPKWKVGDRVRIVTRDVTEDDRKAQMFYSHMAGITGMIDFVYEGAIISIRADLDALPTHSTAIHKEAAERMRAKINEEQRKSFEPHEINFPVNFCLLVNSADLEAAGQ
jgi:hypothetical protein